MQELVSIIVPVYNVENYLEECLASITKQTYHNLEIILVNDGSTDNSFSICQTFAMKDNRAIVIDKVNEGLSIARQTGIDNCRGLYFSTVDSDDVLNKYYIEKLYRQIKKEQADVCLCGRKSFGLENVVYNIEDADDVIITSISYNCRRYFKNAEIYQMSDSWNKMYKTDFVREAGVRYYLPPEYNGTDLLFNHLLLLHCPKICTVKEPLYNYRIIPHSRVRKKNKPLQEGFEFIIAELIKERIKLNYPEIIDLQIYAIYVSMIKYVTQDIVEECFDQKEELHERLAKCIGTSKKFPRNTYVKIRKQLSPFTMKIFFGALNHSNVRGIEFYYSLRQIIKEIREK